MPREAGGATSFARLICELGLGDVWRDRYPDKICYSCYSATPRALSRIDLCLCNPLAMPNVTLIEYVPRSISDHSLLRTLISVPGVLEERLWKVNSFWLQLFPADDPLPRASITFIRCNKVTAAWDALQVHLRDLIIKQISAITSHTRESETLVSAEATRAEEHYISQPSPESEQSWLVAQTLYKQVVSTAAEKKRFFMQQQYFEEGKNTGHLAVISQSQQAKLQIDAI